MASFVWFKSTKRLMGLVVGLILVAACCSVQLMWTLQRLFVTDEMTVLLLNMAPEEHQTTFPANTHWDNVQYHSGTFEENQTTQDEHIIAQCSHLTGYHFMNFPSSNNTLCLGPLATNTTCCFCYVSRHVDPPATVDTYKYWSCAVARPNSLLLPTVNSTDPNNNTSTTTTTVTAYTNGKRVAWITGRFGHADHFEQQVKRVCQQVRDLNVFDPQDIYCYWQSPDYVLQQRAKFHRHLQYRNDSKDMSAKGGGFWFHKSLLLRHHLDLYDEGDFLVYTDIDRMDVFQLGTVHAVVKAIAQRRDDLSMELVGNAPQATFTKEDVLTAFNASQTLRQTPQTLANLIVIRNTPTMKRLMDAWIDCVSDWHMVSDEPSVLPNAPQYFDHRHDQSILGLLIKTLMIKQSVVGPPARPYHYLGEIVTFRFKHGVEPACPFATFDIDRFKVNLTNNSISDV